MKYRYRDRSTYSVSDLQIIAMNNTNYQPFDENVVHLFKNKMNRGDKKVLVNYHLQTTDNIAVTEEDEFDDMSRYLSQPTFSRLKLLRD